MKYHFILLTTCDVLSNRLFELERLITSVDTSEVNEGIRAKHIVLLQRTKTLPDNLKSFESEHRVFLTVEKQISLSKARNMMIDYATNHHLFDQAEICAFPDDDAWYPPKLMSQIKDFFKNNQNIDILASRYGSQPELNNDFRSLNYVKGRKYHAFIQTVSSNTLFLRSQLAKKNGYFDEKLGVGAELNGGEDLDFGLRALTATDNDVVLFQHKLVGHRDALGWVRGKYYVGSLFAISRSAPHNFFIFLQVIRKILVGFYLVIRKELSLANFIAGTKNGLKGISAKSVFVKN